MAPTSGATFIAFLLLVAPGLLADLLESKRVAGVKESAFREAGRVALFSLICSVAGAVIVGTALALLSPLTNFDPFRAVADRSYAEGEFWWAAVAVGAVSAVGCVTAVVIQKLRLGSLTWTIEPHSAWTKEYLIAVGKSETYRGQRKAERAKRKKRKNKKKIDKSPAITVQVKLLSGESYIGVLAGMTADLEQKNREITLAQPLWVEHPWSSRKEAFSQFDRVVLRGDWIKAVAFPPAFVPKDGEATNKSKEQRVRGTTGKSRRTPTGV